LNIVFKDKIHKTILLIGTLIFACHPLNTQAITYIVQRMASMAGMFYIGALLFYLKSRLRMIEKADLKSFGLIFVAFLCFIGSILSKQNGITIPIAFLCLELIFIFPKNKKKSLLFLSPFIIGSIILIASLALIYPENITLLSSESIRYFATQQEVLFLYLKLFLVPVGFNIDHLYPLLDGFSTFQYILVISHIAIIALSFFLIKKNKYKVLGFAILLYYISHLTESSIIYIFDTMVEHRMYIPMLALSIIATYLLSKIPYKKTILPILLILPILTFIRNKDYTTQLSLWESSAKMNPENSRALYNIAQAYYFRSEYEKASYFNKKSFDIVPSKNNLFLKTVLDIKNKKFKSAERSLKELAQNNTPQYRMTYLNALFFQYKDDFNTSLQYYNSLDFAQFWPAIKDYTELMMKKDKLNDALNRIEAEHIKTQDNPYILLSKMLILEKMGKCKTIDYKYFTNKSYNSFIKNEMIEINNRCL